MKMIQKYSCHSREGGNLSIKGRLRNKFGLMIIFSVVLFLFSCRKDEPPAKSENPADTAPVVAPQSGVFIINEGNFTWGNSSISYYNYADSTITEDIFQMANNRSLGDVGQSMEIFNGKAYVVVNNSGKVEVVNPADFKSIATITGLASPRYFLGVAPDKAYVTDFKSNAVAVVDLNSNAVIKHISCPGWTEELVLANEKAFITNIFREYIYVVDTSTDAIEDSIKTGYGPSSIRKDINGKLWVLCSGNDTIKASLHRINPANKEVELTFSFPNNSDSPGKLEINGTKDTLYYLNKGVYQLSIDAASLSASPVVAQDGSLFYGLGIEPGTGIIYVVDAIDYVQKGIISRYRPDGTFIDSFKAGIIPGDFYFYR